ncbi:hypothetical protein BCR33DRAFT_714403 [Rhizoclosmatium globosum]|uniref:Uncharacterized protein n=1 Tax=Rhizoclosmatium globosum TaxID=329046 RepID=A0A1Y2CPA7_9FUNG|nr:hypothetical protein BCR33DRAFT_714403 [Rhizoclosmatium globosum]|eukprot:ORY48674.1 hypothetical protein BCR33DRAFT_714403 [Rhizoclosmatium globosum]
MYKALISHCQSLLSKHHALARGTYKIGAGAVHESGLNGLEGDEFDCDINDFTEPVIIVDEKEMLAEYWKENNIELEADKVFMEETLMGCVRHEKVIDITLKLFYKNTGGRYLKSEYNLFAVLAFLCLYRLPEDMPFSTLTKFFKSYNPTKMARFLAFLFDSAHLIDDGILSRAWGTILDRDHIKAKMLLPLLSHADEAKTLIEDLIIRSEKGMVPKKSTKPNTEAAPFVLTVQNPRKIPEPPYTHSTLTKARPIPKSVYTGTGELEAIEKAKAENRRRVQEQHEKFDQSQYEIAKKAIERSKRPVQVKVDSPEPSHHPSVKAKPVPTSLYDHVPIKMTTATILREDALVRQKKLDEEKLVSEVEFTLRDTNEFHNWRDELQKKAEEERKLDMEKLRLKVQLLHEESFLSRQEKVAENQTLVKEVKEEKETLKVLTEQARKELDIENKKKIEDVHEIMEGVIKAKEKVMVDKQKKAADIVTETQLLREKAQREAEEELARKVELIQQIRLLEKAIPPVGALVKTLDLTETSNLGLLGEMSIVELHERLAQMKLQHIERAEEKRAEIIQHKTLRLTQISEKLEEIDRERQERKLIRLEQHHQTTSSSTTSHRSSVAALEQEVALKMQEREALLNKDPKMKELHDKLMQKRALRLEAKNAFSSKKLSGTAASMLVQKVQEKTGPTSISNSRLGSALKSIGVEKLPVLKKKVDVGVVVGGKSVKGVVKGSSKQPVAVSVQSIQAPKAVEEDEAEYNVRIAALRTQLEEQRAQLLKEIAQEEADAAQAAAMAGVPTVSIMVHNRPQSATAAELKMVTFAPSVESLQ